MISILADLEVVVSKPICDDDFLQRDQLTETIVFHEDDRDVMFNNIEEFFLFKDDLEFEFEEYEPKRDNVQVEYSFFGNFYKTVL